MLKRLLSSQLHAHLGHRALIRGWLHNCRLLGKIGFLILRDREGLVQIVLKDRANLDKVLALQPGSVLAVQGTIAVNAHCDLGLELIDSALEIEVSITKTPPIEYWHPTLNLHQDTQLDARSCALRHRKMRATFRIQAEIAASLRRFMSRKIGAIEYFGPSLICGSSEGGADAFCVDYYGQSAYLAQSNQLYKQIMVGVFERVFAISAFFRAEESHTTRHLSEGRQLEFEMGFFQEWGEIMQVQENLIKQLLEDLKEHCAQPLSELQRELPLAPRSIAFPRLSLAKAQDLVFEKGGVDERGQSDLSPAAERILCRYARDDHATDFLFITDWGSDKRPFYSFPNEKTPHLTNTFDLLGMGGEISSGGQRRHTAESVVEGLLSKGLDPGDFGDYLMAFRAGLPPHGGFGLGIERLTMLLLGLENIRDATPFPSDTRRVAAKRLKSRIFWGGESVRNEAVRQLKERGIAFQILFTPHSPQCLGSLLVKSAVFKGVKTRKYTLCAISSEQSFDLIALEQILGESVLEPDENHLLERFGLSIGHLPPFGHLIDLPTLLDQQLLKAPSILIATGVEQEWAELAPDDLSHLVNAKIAKIAN